MLGRTLTHNKVLQKFNRGGRGLVYCAADVSASFSYLSGTGRAVGAKISILPAGFLP